MPESENKKRASKSPRSSAKAGANAGADDPVIGSEGSDGPKQSEKTATEGLIPAGFDTPEPTCSPESEAQEARGGGIENGVTKIHNDDQLVDQVITEMIANVTIDSLTEDIADQFCEPLLGNPEFRQRLIDAVMRNERFRSKLSRAIINGLN